MNRSSFVFKPISVLSVGILFTVGCSMKSSSNEPSNAPSPAATLSSAAQSSAPQSATAPATASSSGALQPGQASGSYTAKGETVELKYAYAARGERFGDQSIILLITDQPIPPDALAEEIKDQKMLFDGKLRGLEYVFSENGYWVRYHPGQAQTSQSGTPKEYSVQNEVLTGADEDNGEAFEGKYKRSVRFSAAIGKE